MKYKLITSFQGEIKNMLQLDELWPDNFTDRLAAANLILLKQTPYTSTKACLPFFKRHKQFTLPQNNTSNLLFFGESNHPYQKRCAIINSYLPKLYSQLNAQIDMTLIINTLPLMLKECIHTCFFLHELMNAKLPELDNLTLERIANNANIIIKPLAEQVSDTQKTQWRHRVSRLIQARQRECQQCIDEFITFAKPGLIEYIKTFKQFNIEYNDFINNLYQQFKEKLLIQKKIVRRLISKSKHTAPTPAPPNQVHCCGLFTPSKKRMCHHVLTQLPNILNLHISLSDLQRLHYYCTKSYRKIQSTIDQTPVYQQMLCDHLKLYPIVTTEPHGLQDESKLQQPLMQTNRQ